MARKCKKGKKEKGNKEEEIIALSGSRRQLNPVDSQDRSIVIIHYYNKYTIIRVMLMTGILAMRISAVTASCSELFLSDVTFIFLAC
jgi:hypothetical protein